MVLLNILCFTLSCFLALFFAFISLSYESILLTIFNTIYFIYINYKF